MRAKDIQGSLRFSTWDKVAGMWINLAGLGYDMNNFAERHGVPFRESIKAFGSRL